MALFQAKHVWVQQLADGVAALVLDREQSAVNFLDPAMLDDLDRALDSILATSNLRLLVIRSGKTANFCHGPPPSLLATWSKGDFQTWSERGQSLCGKLADLPIPSVCVMAGTCFDAGLELALACDHRVAVNRPSTEFGFPELEWGMIPCWGGTQRLPRLIGLDQSLHMLLAGERLDAREAWACNLADDLAEEVGEEPPTFLGNPVKRDWSTFPRNNWRQRWLESNRLGRWLLFRGADRIVRTRIPLEMPAPATMLELLRNVYRVADVRGGLEMERQSLQRLAEQPALRHMLRLLLHRERLRPPTIGAPEKARIRQIGVNIGGIAGLSLYLHSVAKGYEVVYRAATKEGLAMGMLQVGQLLQVEVEQGNMSERQLAKILGGFRGTYTWTHFDKLQLVLDATDGPLADKQQFYQEMEKQVADDAIIVPVNILHRIEDLQQGLQHPERMVGLRLIEPWNRGTLAEIAATATVAQPCAQRVREWAIGLGKCCLSVPDRVGGVAMRVWLPALNEAGLMIKEGVRLDRIDKAMRRFGMNYGPCEWMDRLGIDQVAALVKAMQPLFAGRIAFESGFALMVEKQWLGNLSERGFYEPGWRNAKPHRDAIQLWRTQSQGETASPTPALSQADEHTWIQNRLVTLMLLEAVRCLDEGLLADADDLDCAMCLTGWATHRGGPVGHARDLGVESLTSRCNELASLYGPRFAPLASLPVLLAPDACSQGNFGN